ncbi:glycine zipper 2TM domain-containing protein [Chitinivorax sp. B]|uniref:glycine zipper 2TM domain-containing protein n=1 Tax=Chitinivorax sp. B TaxID=2502235 RepID=UPI0010F44DC0|nr:glycine zipper 2TM domain-containing protein [Chitinivorax sp. B]
MNKSMMIGILVGAAGVVGGGAFAGYQYMKGPEYADVISALPVKETIKTPVQTCRDVTVTHRRAVKDNNQITGTVLGGVVGGVLGHQVGSGRGNTVATVAGAVAGGYAGNRIQKNMQDGDTYTTTQQRCKTTTKSEEKLVGYDVKYRLGEAVGALRLDYDPGPRIPVKDGQLLLAQAPAATAPTQMPVTISK